MQNILRVDASMRISGSYSRMLTDKLIEQLSHDETKVIRRDLLHGVPLLNEDWLQANSTLEDDRDDSQRMILKESDMLIEEIESSDILVVGLPIYNFGVPAAFKAWIDLIARARKTFQYGKNGPVGLLKNKRSFTIVTSGGTQLNSEIDFVSGWLKHVFQFIGITEHRIIDASGLMKDEAGILARVDEVFSTL